MLRIGFSAILILSVSFYAFTQTVGLFLNDSLANNGYTLFTPAFYSSTYMIDNCGELIHEWPSDSSLSGMATYMLDDGSILRAVKYDGLYFGAGYGGKLEQFDWDGNLTWEYLLADSSFHQHHDIEVMPNGNILVFGWVAKTVQEAIANGRDTNTISADMWPESILELKPLGTDSAEIVWRWNVWDHLIQEYDSTKPNFGVVGNHPHRIDINFPHGNGGGGGQGGVSDWLHFNSIDYNPSLDQIVVSCHTFNEIWVIDHSTTTAEAATSSGGNSGRGGDLLYRWGNPFAYDQGLPIHKKLYRQHDARWIDNGSMDDGKISIYNNGVGRPGGNYSTVEIIDPPLAGFNYNLTNNVWGPDSAEWIYKEDPPSDFYSTFTSSAEQFVNGNMLIAEGETGRFFEVTKDGTKLWEYASPVEFGGPLSQGNVPTNNMVFKIERFATDHIAFNNKDVSQKGPIEKDPLNYTCTIYNQPTHINEQQHTFSWQQLAGKLLLADQGNEPFNYNLYNVMGQMIKSDNSQSSYEIDLSEFASSQYIIQIRKTDAKHSLQLKISVAH